MERGRKTENLSEQKCGSNNRVCVLGLPMSGTLIWAPVSPGHSWDNDDSGLCTSGTAVGMPAEPAHASLPFLMPCLLYLLSLLSHKALTSQDKPWEAEARWGLGWCPAGNRRHSPQPQLGELGLKTVVAPDVLQSHVAVKGLWLRDSTQTPDSSKFPENGR